MTRRLLSDGGRGGRPHAAVSPAADARIPERMLNEAI